MEGMEKWCLVCSSSEEDDPGTAGGNGTTMGSKDPHFSQFCDELELKSGKVREFSAVKFLKTSSESLFVCSECLKLIRETMECRNKLEKEELEVLRLQIQLLGKMKALQQCTDLYLKEMRRIMEKVRGAEVSFLEGEEEETSGGGKGEVLRFREKIMDVATYLGMFHEDMDQKLGNKTDLEGMAPPVLKVEPRRTKRNASKSKPHQERIPENDNSRDYFDAGGDDDMDWNSPPEQEDDEEFNLEETAATSEEEEETVPKKPKLTRGTGQVVTSRKLKDLTPHHRNLLKTFCRRIRIPPVLFQVDFSGMGPLQSHFIIQLLLRPKKEEPPPEPPIPGISRTPGELRRIYTWKFNPPTKTLTLGDFPITVEEREVPKTLTFSCSLCDFRTVYDFSGTTDKKENSPGFRTLEASTFDHVLSSHVPNGFTCAREGCPKQAPGLIKTLQEYSDHYACHGNIWKKLRRQHSGSQEGQEVNPEKKLDFHERKRKVSLQKLETLDPPNARILEQFASLDICIRPQIYSLDFEDMSIWQSFWVIHVANHGYATATPPPWTHPYSRTITQVREEYRWSYDLPSKKITLAGHELEVLDNGQVLMVICGTCGHQDQEEFNFGEDPGDKEKVVQGLKHLETAIFDHVLGSHVEGAFGCARCPKVITSMAEYRQHLNHHGYIKEPWRRQGPRKRYPKKKGSAQGSQGAKEEKRVCDQCGVSFVPKYLETHKLLKHATEEEREEAKNKLYYSDKPSYPCSTCGRTFINKTRLRKHEYCHLDKDQRPTIQCPLCGRICQQQYFREHPRHCPGHRGDKKEKCGHCGKEFPTKQNLQLHVKRMHEEASLGKPFSCELCGKRFKMGNELKNHLRNGHGLESGEYGCGKGCGRRFERKFTCQLHEEKCAGEGQ